MDRLASSPPVVAAALLAAACGGPAGPDDLTVDLDIVPGVVSPGDSLAVQVTIANPTSETVRITSHSCAGLGEHRALRDGEPVELDGMIVDHSEVLCIAAIVPIEVPPGETHVQEWTIWARVAGEPAPAGDYLFRFESIVDDLDDAEDTFVVEAR